MAAEPAMTIDSCRGGLQLRAASLGRGADWTSLRGLIGRLLASDDVQAVVIRREQSCLLVTFRESTTTDPGTSSPGSLARRLAQLLRRSSAGVDVPDLYADVTFATLTKCGDTVVAGEVARSTPRRTQIVHPLFRRSPGLEAILLPLLLQIPGVTAVRAHAAAGRLIVEHSTAVDAYRLLVTVEEVFARIGKLSRQAAVDSKLLLTMGCVGLALGSFSLPVLVPITAAALVAINWQTLLEGSRELMTLRWKLPALYTVIMVTTLVTGGVLPAALMQTTILGWYWWSNRHLRQQIRRLLLAPELTPLHVESVEGAAIATADDPLEACESARAGDPKSLGLHRFRDAHAPLIPAFARLASDARPTDKADRHAAKVVPYTFAMGAAAIASQNVSTLAAVLRPDFATGPSVTERISLVSGVARLLDAGWVCRNPEVMVDLQLVETIFQVEVLDGSQQLLAHNNHGPGVVELSIRQEDVHLPSTGRSVRCYHLQGSAHDCRVLLGQLTAGLSKTVVIGPAAILTSLDSTNCIRISTAPVTSLEHHPADLVCLDDQPQPLVALDLLLKHGSAFERAWPIVMACNAVSIVGAFLVGLSSLHVVVLTNLGAWAAYRVACGRTSRPGQPAPVSEFGPVPPSEGQADLARPSSDDTPGRAGVGRQPVQSVTELST